MANRPNMGYSSAQANEMLMGLPGAMATETGRMLKATKTGLGNWWDSLDDTSKVAAGLSVTPVGDVAGLANDARLFYQNPEMRTPANFGLSALGLLPLIPSMGMVKGVGKGISGSIVPSMPTVPKEPEQIGMIADDVLAQGNKQIQEMEGLVPPVQRVAPQTAIRRSMPTDPNKLVFREDMQNRTSEIREAFPDGEYPPIVTVRTDKGVEIIDGHNRSAVAIERGQALPAVELSEAEYDALKAEGYDDMEISYAALMDANEADAADAIHYQFPGSGVSKSGMDALDVLQSRYGQEAASKGLVPPVKKVELPKTNKINDSEYIKYLTNNYSVDTNNNTFMIDNKPAFTGMVTKNGDIIETYDIEKAREVDWHHNAYMSKKALAEEYSGNAAPFYISEDGEIILPDGFDKAGEALKEKISVIKKYSTSESKGLVPPVKK
jgi:hypothetical protein